LCVFKQFEISLPTSRQLRSPFFFFLKSGIKQKKKTNKTDKPFKKKMYTISKMAEVEWDYYDRVDLRCECCNEGDMTAYELEEHYKTEEHKEKIKKDGIYCIKCKLNFPTVVRFDRHCQSNKHKNGKLDKTDIFCDKCKTQCNTKAEFEAHLRTKKHLKDNSFVDNLHCDACETQCFNKNQFDIHCKTKKHLRNTNTNAEGISRTVFETRDQGTQSD
jgi:hypothetical protein